MPSSTDFFTTLRVAVIGHGRLGSALVRALGSAVTSVPEADAVLLCVPDAAIASAAADVAPGPLVGHCSGATGLGALAPHEAFSLHPLMTVTTGGAQFGGVSAAVDGSSPRAHAYAVALARRLAMIPITVAAEDRPVYHAAASMASNFLVTLEVAAERLAAQAGVGREALVPLVRATVDNWAAGGADALTGPVARGDEETVARQRAAIDARLPALIPLFDSLVDATRAL